MVDTYHDQIILKDQNTVHEYHLNKKKSIPHILRGASNYKKIGCCINISLLL